MRIAATFIPLFALLTAAIAIDAPVVASEPAKIASQQQVETEQHQQRRKLLGVWQDNYKGKRTMTLNDDGSGVMLVELSGLQAALFASNLRFEMKWSMKGNKLVKTTVSGEPADKVNLVLKMMGDTAEDTILEVSDERLLLLDKNGKAKYDWRRAKEVKAGTE